MLLLKEQKQIVYKCELGLYFYSLVYNAYLAIYKTFLAYITFSLNKRMKQHDTSMNALLFTSKRGIYKNVLTDYVNIQTCNFLKDPQ